MKRKQTNQTIIIVEQCKGEKNRTEMKPTTKMNETVMYLIYGLFVWESKLQSNENYIKNIILLEKVLDLIIFCF